MRVGVGKVELELRQGDNAVRWNATVGFTPIINGQDELAILGHAGFFNHVQATFDGDRHEVDVAWLSS
jgi:hypothetical protein